MKKNIPTNHPCVTNECNSIDSFVYIYQVPNNEKTDKRRKTRISNMIRGSDKAEKQN